MAKLRITQITVAQQPGTKLRIFEIDVLSGTMARPPAKLQVYRIAIEQTIVVLPATSDQTAESRTVVTLTATHTQTVTAWSWTQTAGPAVTLTGSGATRTFTAPATYDGVLLAFAVTATYGGFTTPPVTANVTVRAHQWWTWRSGAWQPCAPLAKL